MTKIIIIRHGETEWNKKGVIQGSTDIPLSKTGIKQSEILAKRLKKEKINIIYASRLKRSLQTAEIIAKYHNLNIIQNKNLNEMSWGIWEGLTFKEIREKYPELWKKRKKNKFNFRVTKGESPADLKKRINNFINKNIKNKKGKVILIAGHGGMNRTMIGTLLKLKPEKILEMHLSNVSVNVVELKGNKAKLKLFNCSKHLS